MLKKYLLMACAASFFVSGTANALDEQNARTLIDTKISKWLNDPVIIDAIIAQNEQTSGLSEGDIKALDDKWRAGDTELIEKTLSNPASEYLQGIVANSEGLYSELFIMDAKGLNVSQSAKTSDYWQGDEAKWQKTYLVGPNAIDIGEVEFDESSQTYQIQLSIPVVKDGTVIGAATIGMDAEMVE